MRPNFFKLLLACALLAPGALARQTPPPKSAPKSPPPAPTRADEAAPSVERLRAHVTYLASDKLEGRKTGTDGAEAAAAYVAREFAAAGLKTAPPTPSGHREGRLDAGYLRTFPYVAGVEAGASNAFTFTRREGERAATLDLRLTEDWMPLGFTAVGAVEDAAAVFVGFGIVASEMMYDDYAGADVKDKVAVALAGVPGADGPHNPVARYNELRLKASAARDRGARALVLVAREERFADDRMSRLRYDNSGDAGLPVVVISRAAARRILEAGGVSLDEFERRARSAPPVAPANNPSPHGAHRSFAAPLRNVSLTIKTDVTRRTVAGFNVVGVLEGSDAKLKEEVVVLGAHYDHLGRGGPSSLAPRGGDIHYGADDNASGTAALVELARLLSRERPRRTVVFVAFGGEE
ncbi:MAG TPA: M28 family peptidase, partial [Pyrinomonadaceae bacterium]|nr:M28 family peptidase [Pyrinomonadaceae bacterium]